jgi:PAS domain S-box-containing protein
LRILSVDDKPENRYLLEVQLSALGWEVVSVSNGVEALEQLERGSFDAIVSDILMPDMDGFQLCREIMGRPQLRRIPFVFYTATYTDPKDEQLGFSMGASRFVAKPAEPDDLANIVREAVEEARSSSGAPPSALTGTAPGDDVLLKTYNERLVQKLDRKVAQLELATRDLREVFENTFDAIFVIELRDGGFVLESINRQAERVTGFTCARASGLPPEEVFGPALGARLGEELRRCRDAGAPVRHEMVLGPRPHERSYDLLLSPLKDARGQVVRITVFGRDVTEGKRAQAGLLQAQKMESVGRLAGGIAHDFNNILTAILGYADLTLSRLAADDPVRPHVEQIQSAGRRASSLTRQLLVFSRHRPVEHRVLDLNAFLSDMRGMLGRLLGEDIRLAVQLGQPLGPVKADPGQLEQVILNLCVNARDAMPRGGGLVLGTRLVEPSSSDGHGLAGRHVELAVTDTGCGMSADVLSHIFEPFFTTKEVGKGTGLGLSTVFGIVQGLGGRVTVSSEVGRGSTFRVQLPVAEGPVEAPAPEPPPPARATGTVLVVEDDEQVLRLTVTVLQAGGYAVLSASRAQQALLAHEHHAGKIDLLLTDVVIPDMSGRDLATRLAALRPGLRVLFASGYTSGVLLHDEATGSGAAFLQKPFTPAALLRKVREVIDAPDAQRP